MGSKVKTAERESVLADNHSRLIKAKAAENGGSHDGAGVDVVGAGGVDLRLQLHPGVVV